MEAIVTAAEGLVEHAQWRVLSIRAARVRCLAEKAREAVEALAIREADACSVGWQGENTMSSLAYRVEEIALLVRQSRRQFTTYQRRRARLEAKQHTTEGSVRP